MAVPPAAAATRPGPVIVLLALAAFGSARSMRVLDAALPKLADDFGIGIHGAANVITVFAIAYGCLQVVYGPSGDRFGKLTVIALACIGGALASLACALAPGYSALLFARFAAGATMAAMIPLSMAWIGDNVAYEERQPVLARFLTGQIAGLASGQAAGGVASELASWRLPFWGLAVWFVVVALLLGREARAPRHRLVRRTGGNAAYGLVAQCKSVLAQAWARRVLITVFLEGVTLYGPFAFFATHLHVKHGLSLSAAGLMLMSFAVGGMSYALASRILLGRFGEAGLARNGGLLLGISIAVLGLAPNVIPAPLFALPALFGAGLGFYMLHNTLQINATQMAPASRGTAVALFASCFFLGQSVGVALGGFAVERAGTTPVIALGAVGVALVGVGFSNLRARRGKVAGPTTILDPSGDSADAGKELGARSRGRPRQ